MIMPPITTMSREGVQNLRELYQWYQRVGRKIKPPDPDSTPGSDDGTVQLLNYSGSEIPAGGLVHVKELYSPDQPAYQAHIPYRTAMLAIAVAATIIPEDGSSPGRGFVDGFPLVRMDATEWATAKAGQRLGTWPDSFDAFLCNNGPLLILGMAETPLVRAAFLRRRDGTIFCADETETVAAGFEHKHFSVDFTLSSPRRGTVVVNVR